MSADPRPTTPPRRAPAGAAVLREDVTDAIRTAVFGELAAVGYARMSIEGIARRAGVGKTAVYRRWKSKLALVLDLVSAVAAEGLPAPATGSLYGDARALLEVAAHALRHPVASQVVPDLLVEAARHPEIADAVKSALLDGQHGVAAGVVREAVARGELPEGADVDRALDLIVGPLYWRLVVVRTPLPAGYLDDLATSAVAALKA
ncbi:TetR family transcriptional regulator [Streptomyces agglomeratus]|uniref:TetR/AcrR family transcriptional regulator n=1 Tax=Streptomyces agglomeratus TaxID=285458 RepID=UPI0008546B51|nr:TetR/AcrR family transcriptional regulator [Streptomyces agglomeratus]OEJ39298.1 TetR family transcriptional regulator [Streptomyces agglomeratus]OEJ46319.1 TetR family transcriptional regulator [Streptomyces agglomeratus]OEJ51818.1 TetR family transcriptional regulator [Streptomyces agglomeratus]